VVFLGLGIAAGSEGIGGVPFDDYPLAFRLGSIALVLILFDGGLNTAPAVVRRAALPALLLATLGVALTAAIVAVVGLALGLPRALAVLTGAVVSSTDAAAVFAVLRTSGVRLRESTAATLEVESGVNDPMAILLTLVATDWALGTLGGAREIAVLFGEQLAVGAAGGALAGLAGRVLLRAVQLPAAGLYPVLTLAVALLAFGIPTLLGGSGFLAVYVAAIVLAAGPLPYRAGVRRVHDALAWLAQIAMFVMLGLLVFPSRLREAVPIGLVLAAALAFVARPAAVLALLAPLGGTLREKLFVAWVGLRGAVPIVLAAYPAARGVAGGEQLFHLVFFVVLVNSFVPGATMSWLARRLGLARSGAPAPAATVELVSLGEFPGQFVWYHVSPVSAAAETYVRDLGLPEGSTVALVVRGPEVIVPRGSTLLRPGDQVCAFATPETRAWLDLVFGGAQDDST